MLQNTHKNLNYRKLNAFKLFLNSLQKTKQRTGEPLTEAELGILKQMFDEMIYK